MITVTCRKRDAGVRIVPKYDNLSDFDVTPENPNLPNGVYGYRHLRRTSPQVEALSPLAAWLALQFDGTCQAGTQKLMYGRYLRCFNGKTEADLLREEAKKGSCNGSWWNGPDAVRLATERAENVIHCYDLENKLAQIDQWLFPIIEPEESDEQYWNRVADEIRASGITRVICVNNPAMGPRTEKEFIIHSAMAQAA
jgi:hypothetical protein